MKDKGRLLKEGKLNIDQLKDLIFQYIEKYAPRREEVLKSPYIGEDCAVLDTKGKLLSVSSDPITAGTKNMGRLAVHVNLNDIAASGAEPLGIMVTLLCPLGTKECEIAQLMEELCAAAAQDRVQILGGHTEITSAVNRMIVSITALGILDEAVVSSIDFSAEDYDIYMTKDAGLEGAYIISHEKSDELEEVFDERDWAQVKTYGEQLSVVPDARIARKYQPILMHDVTEGGVLGALWEICELMKVGACIDEEKIPFSSSVRKISLRYQLNPMRLISSGSLMFVARSCHRDELGAAFEQAGIRLSRIGHTTRQRQILLNKGRQQIPVQPPESDELYKIY